MLTVPTFLLVPTKAIQRPQGESLKRSQDRWSVIWCFVVAVFEVGARRRLERVILPVVRDQVRK